MFIILSSMQAMWKRPLEIFPVKIIILIVLLKKDDSFTTQVTQLSFI